MIAVGKRVFVHCPDSRSGSVVLADASGKVLSAVYLADGVEVEVVAWRVRVVGDAHYRVRAPSNGADGWLPAANLRSALVSPSVTEAAATETTPVNDAGAKLFGSQTVRPLVSSFAPTTQAAPDTAGRRFGQCSEPGRPPESPTPIQEDPGVDVGRLRFGRHS